MEQCWIDVHARAAMQRAWHYAFEACCGEYLFLVLIDRCTSAILSFRWPKVVRIFRRWHHGGFLWARLLERSFIRVLATPAAVKSVAFACGKCNCKTCERRTQRQRQVLRVASSEEDRRTTIHQPHRPHRHRNISKITNHMRTHSN